MAGAGKQRWVQPDGLREGLIDRRRRPLCGAYLRSWLRNLMFMGAALKHHGTVLATRKPIVLLRTSGEPLPRPAALRLDATAPQ
jgi:hypothetical protein